MHNIKKILIIAPSWVGDIVMSQSLFSLLIEKYGNNLQIDVLVNPAFKDLVLRMKEVTQVFDNHFAHGKLQLFSRIKLGFNLRKNNYDQTYVLPNSIKSAITAFFTSKIRIGFTGEKRYGLINQRYNLDKKHLPLMVERFCALGNNGTKPTNISMPHLKVDAENQKILCDKFNLNNKNLVAFCPGAEYGPSKRWPEEYFAKLATLIAKEKNQQIIILGSNKDSTIAERIKTKTKTPITNLCGKTKLADVVDLLALCKNVITNDSGLMHITASINTPQVAIFGSTTPKFTPPLSNRAHVLKENLACSPCFKRVCKYGHYNCLNMITPHLVFESLKDTGSLT